MTIFNLMQASTNPENQLINIIFFKGLKTNKQEN